MWKSWDYSKLLIRGARLSVMRTPRKVQILKQTQARAKFSISKSNAVSCHCPSGPPKSWGPFSQPALRAHSFLRCVLSLRHLLGFPVSPHFPFTPLLTSPTSRTPPFQQGTSFVLFSRAAW